jgi:inner membrane transporter RhtA
MGSMASLCIGTSFAKALFPIVGAQGTTAYRIATGAIILLVIWRPWRLPLAGRDARTILRYGIALAALNLMFYMSLRTLPLGLAIALEFTGPLTLALVLSRRIVDFVWIAFAVAGLLLLVPTSHSIGQLDPIGVLYALAAGVCWAAYIVFGKRAGNLHGGQATSLGMTIAALIALPIGIAHAGTALFSPTLVVSGLIVGILSSALPYSLEMVALKGLQKKTFGILVSMEPAMGALAGGVILGEHLSVQQWFAIASIIVASVGCATTARRGASTSKQSPA